MNRRALWVSALFVLAACQGSEPTQPGKFLSTPSFAISDGANGGNDDFWFLPPLVSNPNGNPAYLDNGFDGSQAATVQLNAATPIPATVNGNHYAVNLTIPGGAGASHHITVRVGSTVLGSIDVIGSKNAKNQPVKFVIENCALEVDACGVVNLSLGGIVADDEGGVEFPPQGPGGPTVKVVVSDCPDIPTDLPVRGECIRVTTEPPLSGLLNVPATVWACAPGLTGPHPVVGQEQRITMYRYDAPSTTTALAHAHDQCPPESFGDAGFSLRGMVADLFHGRLKSAGRQIVGLIGPRKLYATTMLDVGAGGFTDEFSDFQLVIPAIMTKCGGDGQSAVVGGTVDPTVCVVDLGGEPVEGATVHFAPVNGTVSALSAVTDSDGEASVTWTIALGSNSLVASGNGIGASDFNGPRAGVDPFQPLFHTEGQGPAVPVVTGSETFTATGVTGDPLPIAYGSSGWSYQIDGSPPPTWFSSVLTPFSSTGQAPFGSPPGEPGCEINEDVVTSWPTSALTFLYARRVFTLAAAADVVIGIAIDNDVQVFLDGVDITASNDQEAPVGGLLINDGCPTEDTFTFTASLSAGPHILAIRSKDRGGSSYFDARVNVFVPN